MKIESSTVSLKSSSLSIEQHTKEESLKMWSNNQNGSNSGSALFSDSLGLSKEAIAKLEESMNTQKTEETDDNLLEISDADRQKIEMLQNLLEKLTGKKFKFIIPKKIVIKDADLDKLNLQSQGKAAPAEKNYGWGIIFNSHETHYQKESVSFSADVKVKTSDNKEISVKIDLNMSREFYSENNFSFKAGDALKDPLVINFNAPSASLSGTKFAFDIDSDGDNENISFLNKGSGFLALDQNEDGVINNGSELFGTDSGDGFADLAKYDSDHNNWIDENDAIYSKLRIWTKDENGKDQLLALGSQGVGAIYLGSAATDFSLKSTPDNLDGVLRKTGVFLKEDGTGGTMQHLDLVV